MNFSTFATHFVSISNCLFVCGSKAAEVLNDLTALCRLWLNILPNAHASSRAKRGRSISLVGESSNISSSLGITFSCRALSSRTCSMWPKFLIMHYRTEPRSNETLTSSIDCGSSNSRRESTFAVDAIPRVSFPITQL